MPRTEGQTEATFNPLTVYVTHNIIQSRTKRPSAFIGAFWLRTQCCSKVKIGNPFNTVANDYIKTEK